jgi:hypothetical protein
LSSTYYIKQSQKNMCHIFVPYLIRPKSLMYINLKLNHLHWAVGYNKIKVILVGFHFKWYSNGHIVTFWISWWRKTSGALLSIISVTLCRRVEPSTFQSPHGLLLYMKKFVVPDEIQNLKPWWYHSRYKTWTTWIPMKTSDRYFYLSFYQMYYSILVVFVGYICHYFIIMVLRHSAYTCFIF